MKLEALNCGMVVQGNKKLTAWTRSAVVNGVKVTALLDTRCTKSIVHPKCIGEDISPPPPPPPPWRRAYNTASSKQAYLSAARIRLQIDDRRSDKMAVGVSGHINVDMLLGHDIPQLRKHVRKALDAKPPEIHPTLLALRQLPPPPPQRSMMTTRSQQKAQDQLEKTEQLQQELDGPLVHPFTEDFLGNKARVVGVNTVDEPNHLP